MVVELAVAHGFVSRLTGLIGREPAPGLTLLIPGCRSVHTFGMRFALDLVWLADGRPVRFDRDVPPWRVRACRAADSVVETVAGEGDAVVAWLRG